MTLKTVQDVENFKEAIGHCKGSVWLVSQNERYNLHSALSQIVAIAKLLCGDQSLELFADSKADEQKLLHMFSLHPELL